MTAASDPRRSPPTRQRGDTFWALVATRADSTPDGVVLADGSGRTLTFGGYRDAAEMVAAGLAARRVTTGSVVSWQLPTTIESAVLMAALARLGAVQQPILPLLGERELAYLTRLADTSLLVVPSVFNGVDYEARGRRVAAEQDFDVLVCDHTTDAGTRAGSALPR